MERFTYLATFVSLILGLAVANILSQVSALAKRRATVDWYWVHTSICASLLISLAGEWWVLLAWSTRQIGYLDYLSFLLKPSIMFFASDLLFPEDATAPVIDLKAHYFAVRPVLYSVLLLYPFADLLDSSLKGRHRILELGPPYWMAMSGLTCAYLGGVLIRDERYHALLAVFFVTVSLIGFVVIAPF